MRHPRLVPDNTNFPFMRFRMAALVASIIVILASIGLVAIKGINWGVDFEGGIVLEVKTPQAADLAAMRAALESTGANGIRLQQFGDPTDVLVRIAAPSEVASEAQVQIDRIKGALTGRLGQDIQFDRADFVGPQVSSELLHDGILATVVALALITAYVWFRFEWQYSLGAMISVVHDIAATVGFFAITGIEFDLSSVAAVLTIVGYSLNDKVIVYDRIRENLRLYKAMSLEELLNRSLNETLGRTMMTAATTALALLALVIFGGEVLRGFTVAMLWGVFIGTYSTTFIAAPVLIYFNLRSAAQKAKAGEGAGKDKTKGKSLAHPAQ
ncbi:protein translocase subunit secF [Arboricoccus pini]|uniref:Protein-export membrane protein SecF n=1 Tax=Arboricoccus pini TaxID=1963835 RepID=A0A212QPX7_9PROT|nr:protein translocase subunit SecF [Arboricoccus pini]SNB61501.1 protein translocase subunit secF [Arboricoccus pini]